MGECPKQRQAAEQAHHLPLRSRSGCTAERKSMTTENFNPSRLKQVFDIEAKVFSPTQAGSGAKLLPEIDYYEDRDGIHVVNIESLLSDADLAARLFSSGGQFRLSDLARQDNKAL